jgi:hypothetical protein
VPSAGPSSETLVVVSCLTRNRGPYILRLSATPAADASIPVLAGDDVPRAPARNLPILGTASEHPEPAPLPPRVRFFHLMVREGDAASPSNYEPVRSLLKAVGKRVQVYVASDDVDSVDRDLLADVIVTFDDAVFPLAESRFGTSLDVDGDGRFTILLSSSLNHLGGGRHAVDGFVKVADLDRSVAAPYGNHCDMMYLNAALKAGPHLRTVIAHEYMHAVIFSQKTSGHGHASTSSIDEEGWLEEAIAHLVEDLHGFSTSNVDYRVSAFLSSPESYQLVVDDYFVADLFRSHGNRGSTYLFLRWCVDRYGPDLLPALVHSPRRGVANLEAATGSPFADLYRRWSVALYRSGLRPHAAESAPGDDGFRSINLRAPCADWELVGPRYHRVGPGQAEVRWSASASSSHYAVIEGSTTGAVAIDVAGPEEAQIQVTALPLGGNQPRLDLSVESVPRPGGDTELYVRARICERHGRPVRLSALSWELLTPGPNPHAMDVRPGRLDMLGIASAFGTSWLPAHGELRSGLIRVPGASRASPPLVIKLVGTDPEGRRASAWADLNPRAAFRPGDP